MILPLRDQSWLSLHVHGMLQKHMRWIRIPCEQAQKGSRDAERSRTDRRPSHGWRGRGKRCNCPSSFQPYSMSRYEPRAASFRAWATVIIHVHTPQSGPKFCPRPRHHPPGHDLRPGVWPPLPV